MSAKKYVVLPHYCVKVEIFKFKEVCFHYNTGIAFFNETKQPFAPFNAVVLHMYMKQIMNTSVRFSYTHYQFEKRCG